MFIPGKRVIGQYDFTEVVDEAISVSLNTFEWTKDLFNLFPDPILVTDEQGNIIMVNDAFARMRGVQKEELLGQNAKCFNPPSRICDVLRTKKTFRGISHRDSGVVYMVEIAPVMQDSDLLGAILIAKDISAIESISDKKDEDSEVLQSIDYPELIGQDPSILQLKEKVMRIAKTDLPVLITGETGTGKELLARSIHRHSLRSKGPFVAINCSAFSAGLIDSELFGYEDGAFTGSRKGGKTGLITSANGGTLFLDEIGDMPLELQPKLLRVLEEGSVRKVGSIYSYPIDIRLIAATNKRIDEQCKSGKFRSDLYYRLAGVVLHISPLRERINDIPIIAKHFLKEIKQKTGKSVVITPSALICLKNYTWPGNVRELKNLIMSMAYLCENGVIRKSELPDRIVNHFQNIKEEVVKVVYEEPFELRKRFIYDYLRSNRCITNREYCQIMNVDRSTAFRDLTRLVASGVLKNIGRGRATKYVLINEDYEEDFGD